MNATPPAILGLLALGLFAVIGAEFPLGDDTTTATAPTPPSVHAEPPSAPPPDQSAAQIATLLGRPLFAADRRPVAATSSPADADAFLPRLAGVIVSRAGGSGIFVAGRRTVVVHQGGEVDGYAVKAIEAGKVTVQGPGGQQVLRPTFERAGGPAVASLDGTVPADAGEPPRSSVLTGRRR